MPTIALTGYVQAQHIDTDFIDGATVRLHGDFELRPERYTPPS